MSLEKAFSLFKTTENKISREDLPRLLHMFNIKTNESLSINNDYYDLEEVKNIIEEEKNQLYDQEKLLNAFKLFDPKNTGLISLQVILNLTDQDLLEEITDVLNVDCDGNVNYYSLVKDYHSII